MQKTARTLYVLFALVLINVSVCAQIAFHTPRVGENTPSTNTPPFIKKHDRNGNGKIDVHERKPFIQEVARLRKSSAHQLAAEFNASRTNQQSSVPTLPQLSLKSLLRFDANKNGRLEANEIRSIPPEMWQRFRASAEALDRNRDGVITKTELSPEQLPYTAR